MNKFKELIINQGDQNVLKDLLDEIFQEIDLKNK